MRRMIATSEPELVPISQEPLSIGVRFRANVRRLMDEQSVSQSELAARLTRLGQPSTRNSIKELLTADSLSSMKWIELMSRVFGVSENEITAETY